MEEFFKKVKSFGEVLGVDTFEKFVEDACGDRLFNILGKLSQDFIIGEYFDKELIDAAEVIQVDKSLEEVGSFVEEMEKLLGFFPDEAAEGLDDVVDTVLIDVCGLIILNVLKDSNKIFVFLVESLLLVEVLAD